MKLSWKQQPWVKAIVHLVTLLSLFTALILGVLGYIGVDYYIYDYAEYTQTPECEHKIHIDLYNVIRQLEGAQSNANYFASLDYPSMDRNFLTDEQIAPYLEIEHGYVVNDLNTYWNTQNSNLQISIVDTFAEYVVINTFGDVVYTNATTQTTEDYIVTGALQSPLTVYDEYRAGEYIFNTLHAMLPWGIYVFIACAVSSLVGLIFVAITAGWNKKSMVVCAGVWEKIPTDLWLFGSVAIGTLCLLVTANFACNVDYFVHDTFYCTLSCIGAFVALLVLSELLLKSVQTFAVRMKMRTLWHNTLIVILFQKVRKLCKWGISKVRILVKWSAQNAMRLPMIWRTSLLATAIFAVNGILGMLSMTGFFGWILFAFYNLCMLLFVCAIAWQMKLLQAGAEQLSQGNLQQKIDTTHLYYDCKKHAETLNQIAVGINLAAEEKFRSQRMKTELITNVSHDIKTPLTSIVTTIDLLQQEHTDAQHAEYLALLQRQSMRMKKLVEDLVEASKASTGNIPVDLQPTDLVETIEQALGEYRDRLTAQDLTLITDLPETCTVLADGKLLWRVLDNLLGNVCKYAQAGTRVYLALTHSDCAHITLKNISSQPLNMTADELMERFVRGDSARSTEGSGLGLNIAQSLMQIQNGSLALTIDGDLVKLELSL